jgi:hypothetical protein
MFHRVTTDDEFAFFGARELWTTRWMSQQVDHVSWVYLWFTCAIRNSCLPARDARLFVVRYEMGESHIRTRYLNLLTPCLRGIHHT